MGILVDRATGTASPGVYLVAGAAGAALLPWSAYLATHRLWLWVGLDVAEATALIGTGIAGKRRSQHTWRWASVAGSLLVLDAIVDLSTSTDLRRAGWMAVLEISGALACASLVWSELRSRTGEGVRPGVERVTVTVGETSG